MSSRQCAVDNILLKIKEDFINLGNNSAKELKPTIILLPVGGLNNKNEALPTKKQTYKWGQNIQKQANDYYESKKYGNIVELDNVSNPRGTLVHINVYSKLVDAQMNVGNELSSDIESELESLPVINHRFNRYFDTNTAKSVDVLNKIVDTKTPLSYLAEKLIKYAKNNNVDIVLEDVDHFRLPGNDYDSSAYYSPDTNKIHIAGKLDYTNGQVIQLLLHEIIHSITAKQLKSGGNVNKDFQKIYEHAKKNITDSKFEYALSDIDEFITHLFTDQAFAEELMKLKPINSNRYTNLFQEILDYLINTLGIKSENKTLYNQAFTVASNIFDVEVIKNQNPLEFGSGYLSSKKEEKKVSNVVKDELKQEVFFKRLIGKLNKQHAALVKEAVDQPYNKELNDKIEQISNDLIVLNTSMLEYMATGNKQMLVNLANDILDKMDERIDKWEDMVNAEDVDSLDINDLEETIETIKIFTELAGVETRANAMYKRIKPSADPKNPNKKSILTTYILKVVKKMTGKELTEEDINYDSKDIFVGERGFGTLSDVRNYLGKTIGYLIKDAQSAVSVDNRKSFDEVKKHTDILAKYNEKNGISKDNAFDIFIQKHAGKGGKTTTILTKEYTPEFYEKLREAKSKGEGALAYKKSFADFNGDKRRWEPKDKKYLNKNYQKIQSTPELKQFYDFWQDSMKKILHELPIAKDVNFIPNIAEQSLLDILKSDTSVGQKFKDSISNITGIYDHPENSDAFISDENLMKDEVPLKYIADMDATLKSKNLDQSLLMFMQFANNYKHMSEVLPKTKLFLEEIGSRSFVSNVKGVRISGEKTNIYQMSEDFINMQVKGKMKKEEVYGNINYGKYIDFGLKYTSLLRIGLNPFNAITNVIVGSLGNIIESVGGRYFTTSEFLKAQNTFSVQVWDKDSKVNSLIKQINPLMELEDYENLQSIQIGSKDYLEKIRDLMYSPQRLGEKMMQTSTMIASLMHDKVTTKDGKTISMWEAFDEKGAWNEELMGYKLTEDMIFKTTNKIQRINQMIHGRYSAKDAAALSQNALFRAAFQFKKWIPAAFEARLQGKRFDDRLGYEIEGRYLTLRDVFLKKLFTNPYEAIEGLIMPLLAQKKLLESGKYTELEIYNMRKNMIELTLILASVLMYMGLGPDDDEKINNGWYKFAMSQLDRVSGDLRFFYNPSELNRALSSVPLVKTTNDLLITIQSIPYAFGIENAWYLTDKTYQSGLRKGENKFLAKLIDITPVVKPFADVIRLSKKDVNYVDPK